MYEIIQPDPVHRMKILLSSKPFNSMSRIEFTSLKKPIVEILEQCMIITSKSAPAPSCRLNIDFFYALLRVIKSSNGRVEVEKRLLFKWSLRLIELYTAIIVTQ